MKRLYTVRDSTGLINNKKVRSYTSEVWVWGLKISFRPTSIIIRAWPDFSRDISSIVIPTARALQLPVACMRNQGRFYKIICSISRYPRTCKYVWATLRFSKLLPQNFCDHCLSQHDLITVMLSLRGIYQFACILTVTPTFLYTYAFMKNEKLSNAPTIHEEDPVLE